jgi:hypothetical protein
MRAIRRIVVTLLILAGLFVAADYGARAVAQAQVAASLQSNLDLSEKPEVSLGGFPFLRHVLDGHLDEVMLVGTDLSANGQSLRQVRIALRDVRFSASDLVFGRSTTVRFRSSDGTAQMTGANVTAALKRANLDATVRFTGGVARVSVAGLPEVRVRVALDGSDLVLRPADLPLPVDLRVDVGDLVPDIRYRDIHVDGSVLVLGFTLATNHFDL